MSGKKPGQRAMKRFGPDLEFLWLDFTDHMDFLAAEKFVTKEGKLTEDGIWASKLRVDSPLLVAQGIRKNLLPQRDPALLAAIIATFVNEKDVYLASHKGRYVILFGQFASMAEAQEQANRLQAEFGLREPWLRNWNDLSEYRIEQENR